MLTAATSPAPFSSQSVDFVEENYGWRSRPRLPKQFSDSSFWFSHPFTDQLWSLKKQSRLQGKNRSRIFANITWSDFVSSCKGSSQQGTTRLKSHRQHKHGLHRKQTQVHLDSQEIDATFSRQCFRYHGLGTTWGTKHQQSLRRPDGKSTESFRMLEWPLNGLT